MRACGAGELLEREECLAEFAALVGAAYAGAGNVLVVEGAPGIGKTSVLTAARIEASGAGMTVLSACGAELERELEFGIVRQLFGSFAALHRDDDELWDGAAELARAVVEPDASSFGRRVDQHGALHGLYWLCVSIAERHPLALVVDDAHWADPSSLRWLAYLGRRVSDLAAVVVAAQRPILDPATHADLAALASVSGTVSRTLAPLSEAATAALVRRAAGDDVPDDICRSCHAVTGGNPFYLSELVKDGGAALTTAGGSVEVMAPDGVMRSVVARLVDVSADAVALAKAVAALGSQVQLRHAGSLAGLEPERAEAVADALAEAGILATARPLAFAHPIVRTAVYRELPDGARSTLHHHAARLLHEDGGDAASVATQLLAAEPYGDAWVVARLREGAHVAHARGAPRTAIACLERALREPPERGARVELLFELGATERRLLAPGAEAHLRAALDASETPWLRAQIGAELLPLLIRPGALPDALEIIGRALPGAIEHAPEIAAQLDANRVGLASFHLAASAPDTRPSEHLLARLDPLDLPARLLRGVLATEAMVRGRPRHEVSALLDAALVDDSTRIAEAADLTAFFSAAITAAMCERFDLAEHAYAAALAEAQRRGSVFAASAIWTARSQLYFRLGDVRGAEADARQAHDALANIVGSSPTAMLLDVLIELDDLDGAVSLLEQTGWGGELPPSFFSLLFLIRRMRLRISAGAPDAALADLAVAERWATDAGMAGAPAIPWRAEGAVACLAASEIERAEALAGEQLRLARAFGAPGVLGVAQRVLGLVRRGELELLEASVATLAQTPMRLEHARSLAALGIAQRRAGARRQARATLAEALDRADMCGSRAVAAQARRELRLLGARPRRNRLHGRDALTATELRIASLAAQGMTNTQIAQAAFVTTKTVERHLTNAFAKLAIASRRELEDALADRAPDPVGA